MKQTILFLRNAELFASKEAALAGINGNGVSHVAGQPVVALYGEAGSVNLVFAIGTEAGKCNILATDADLSALKAIVTENSGLISGLRTDLGTSADAAAAEGSAFARIAKLVDDIEAITSGDNSIDSKIAAAIAELKGEGFDAASLSALEDSVDANAAAIEKLNGGADEEGSVAKAVADSAAATKTAYEAADSALKAELQGYADQAEADAIAAAAADAQAKIEALDVEAISETGKYIVSVSETDGKISAELKQIKASEVAIADANEHFAATTVEAALEELYSQAGAGSKVTMKSVAGEGDIATIYTFYQGGEDADHKIGEINIGKEMFIESGEVIEKEGVPYLKLVLNDTANTVLEIDLTKVLDVYTAGNGINVDANVISVRKATDSETFLVVDENGVAIKGVQDAINAAKQAAIGEAESKVNAAKAIIDAYTVNGKAISKNPVLGGADINYAEGVTVNAKIDAVAQAVADEQSRAEEAEGNLQEAIEAAQAAASTVINPKAEGHVTVSEETAEDGHKIYTIAENDIASAQGLADEIARADAAEKANAAAIKAEEERAMGVEGQLTEIVEDINAELGKVKVSAEGTADYLANKVVTGAAAEASNIYAVTATAADDKISLTCKIDTIDGGTY